MKYNCFRIKQYAKMLLVGILLYLGGTIFSHAGDETFTVRIKDLRGKIFEVNDCKDDDTIRDFVVKFQTKYRNEINKEFYYKLMENGEVVYGWDGGRWVDDEKKLRDLGFGQHTLLNFVLNLDPNTTPNPHPIEIAESVIEITEPVYEGTTSPVDISDHSSTSHNTPVPSPNTHVPTPTPAGDGSSHCCC